MDASAARKLLLVQAVEETDTAGELLDAHERAEATRQARETAGGDLERLAAGRAERLCERLDRRAAWCRRALALTQAPPLLGPALLGLALMAGLFTNALGPERRINILSVPLLGLLAWNLAVYAMLAAAAVAARARRRRGAPGAREGTVGALIGWAMERTARARLGRLLARGGARSPARVAAALRAYGQRWLDAAAPLLVARARAMLHLGAALLAVGVVLGMYLRGITFEYQATWESTFLGPRGARALLAVVFAPWAALLGTPIPDASVLATLRAPAAGNAAPWIHLWAVTTLGTVVVPRLALAAVAAGRARRLATRFPVALDSPYFLTLLAGDRGLGTRVAIVPYSYSPSPRAADRLRALLHGLAGARADVDLAAPVAYGADAGGVAPAAGDEAAAAPGERWLVLLFTLAQTPEPEVHGDVIAAATAWAGDGPGRRVLLVTDATPYRHRLGDDGITAGRVEERRRAWDRLLPAAGPRLAHVELESAGDEALERLGQALWPPGAVARLVG
jgi:hypothetical protein